MLPDFPGAQIVKNLPAMQETRVWFLGREDSLEKEMATHSSLLPGESHRQRSLAGYSPWGHKSRTWLSYWTTTSPLSVASFANIFSHSEGVFLFVCLFDSFAVQKLLSLIRSFTTNQLQNVFQCLWGENIRSLRFVPYSVLNANLGASLTCRRFYFRSTGRLLLKTCY